MKKIKVFASIIAVAFCMSALSSYAYMLRPNNERNEDLPDNLNSAKSMAEYAINTAEEDFDKKFEMGSVYMILDSDSKGEVQVTLVEKDKKKPMIVFVYLDTKINKLLRLEYAGWDSKLHPGFIDIQNWKIDYAEALEISKEFYSKTAGFRYDDVIIETCNPYPSEDEDWEDWSVVFRDYQNRKNYYTRIEPYTGEILRHSSWEWLE